MKSAYILTFDRVPTKSYKAFHEALVGNENVEDWFHYIKSSYIIITELDAQELSTHVRAALDSARLPKRHLIVRIDLDDYYGWLPTKAWAWIRAAQENYSE